MKQTRILARVKCPACDNGKIAIEPRVENGVHHLGVSAYCPCCSGKGYDEKWVDISEVAEMLLKYLPGRA